MKKTRLIPATALLISMIAVNSVFAGTFGRTYDRDQFDKFSFIESVRQQRQQYGWLGIEMTDGSIEGIVDIVPGAYVSVVYEGSPAEKAGLYPGDLITKLNGIDIKNARDLKNRLKETIPGERVVLTTTYINLRGHYKNVDTIIDLTDFDSLKQE